ncbi:UDP-N-acetylmuramate dehydrogenase [Halalkalibacterium ligniniphilum]|uniref:UDP-N-acetylmuramate dehydrogenase n=1 Tax=Halalkalibacterium ligniniphilum TaxID=1134413 RepID=UPI000346450F|nr:UDP-N-acetylmuramate dehydrogenase [Halalkalibacterium ligniniphilum]
MKQVIEALREANVGDVRLNEPLSNHTTWKIGGPADLFIVPKNIEGLVESMNVLDANKIPWRAIGRGSNLLVADGGIEGAVIKLDKGLDELEIDGEEIRVGGGYPLIKLATVISREGLSGLEFAGGIPGSVGGAVFMNAGAHGSDISKILTKAKILFQNGRLEWLTNEELEFSYRTSRLQTEKGICVEAVFQLERGDQEVIKQELQKNKDYRRQSQPWNYPTCGSVFRNPLPHYAGQLIEKAGLKGHRIGGAQISDMHANFIVNVGNAKAQDVLALINHVKATIYEAFHVQMETEVEIIGRQ